MAPIFCVFIRSHCVWTYPEDLAFELCDGSELDGKRVLKLQIGDLYAVGVLNATNAFDWVPDQFRLILDVLCSNGLLEPLLILNYDYELAFKPFFDLFFWETVMTLHGIVTDIERDLQYTCLS